MTYLRLAGILLALPGAGLPRFPPPPNLAIDVPNTVPLAPFVLALDPIAPPPGLANCVVALGNFDGVHRGHKAVIARARALAQRLKRPCAVLTFEPHPADYFAGAPVIFRLTPQAAKARLLARLGVDGMIALTFDSGLASLSAEAFVEDILVRRLGISAAVAGYDFHFGKGRAGTPAFLAQAGARLGFAVDIVPKILADAAGSLDAVSSTATRAALAAGDVALARQLLGHDYFVTGPVIAGKQLGRTLGFPTANMALDASCKLAFGIYAVRVSVNSTTHGGVASFGRRPTFDNGLPLLETFLFDFSADLYGQDLEVTFVAFLRGEAKFDDVAALVAQMQADAAHARVLLANRA